MGSPLQLVVDIVTESRSGQLGLFGPDPAHLPGPRPVSRIESNDVDLMHTIAANAVRCGYLIVGASERVYARADGEQHVTRVPRYEEDAVHQLLRRRWLTLGATHHITCGAASLTGTAVLVPKDTRTRVERWAHLQRPPSWPQPHHSTDRSTTGRVVDLDHRRQP